MVSCKKCGNWYFKDTCNCKEFQCRHRYYTDLSDEDDTYIVYAGCAAEAAEKLIEQFWKDEPYDANDVDETVQVVGHGKFVVYAESSIRFYSRRI